MAFKSVATQCILFSLCVFLVKDTSAQCELGVQSPPSVAPLPVAPIAPIGPIGNHVAPGPVEFFAVGPPPTEDLLAQFGASLIPSNPSSVELSIADLVPTAPPTGCTLAHISSVASPIQVNMNNAPIAAIPGQAVEVVEPVIVIETSQCGCTVIRLYWIHEVVTLCPLGTGRWAKTQVLGQAELVHEWVLQNTHDIKQLPPCAVHSPPSCLL